jgi:hypothetical protein
LNIIIIVIYKIERFLIKECEKIKNSSDIYDRSLFKNKFKEIYNKNKYNFQINNNMLSNIITKWKKYQVSNIELLMWLNVLGGRSYNDISQYPVFPWIICDYKRDKIKESDFNTDKTLFRDLSLPLGMIPDNDKGERRDSYILNLK